MTTIYGGRNPYKHLVVLDRIKQWCKLNPGKKALLTGITGSKVLTYYAGSKVFIYSPVKVVEPTIVIDELNNDWYKENYYEDILDATRYRFKNEYMGSWDIRKESRLK